MKIAIVLVSLLGIVACSLATTTYDDLLWDSYKSDFNKVYITPFEEDRRKQIFLKNVEVIDAHNERYFAGEETYEQGINEFTDRLDQEIAIGESDDSDEFEDVEMEPTVCLNEGVNIKIPAHVNWTQLGAVSPVANQGHFNNSWAFAAAGVVESRQFIKTGKMVVLSKQNLVDCCHARDHLTASALICIRKKGGIDTEASYPYRGIAGRCRYSKRTIGAKIKKVFQVRPGNETILALTVAKGPVAAVISLDALKSYKSGVFHNTRCSQAPNFPVLVVGYGHDKSAGDFWILKTPLGTNWGEKGYLRLARGKQNLCGITNRAYYPKF
ncbi:cathepsin L1-like [Drosophila innubila]|uniref:cathepsin L1-like n=1 Tax=Drosophila innubila TaxID=198719 RepID=UPI00148D1D57|nr:cathepsin L1-like [Drosophila innubila]